MGKRHPSRKADSGVSRVLEQMLKRGINCKTRQAKILVPDRGRRLEALFYPAIHVTPGTLTKYGLKLLNELSI